MSGEEWKKRMDSYARVWAEVDLDAIEGNLCSMKRNIGADTRIMAVVKADGYGHGAVPIARRVEGLDFLWGFAVATGEEAHELRRAGIEKPILVLGYTFPYSYRMFAEEEIRPAVFREDSLEELSEAARLAGRKIKVHIKVDTGMGRIGIAPDDTGIAFVQRLLQYDWLEPEGIFTHFARADERDKGSAKAQLKLFCGFVERVERETKISIPLKHCSNSAGILEMPSANLEVVRAGIALYGLTPSREVDMGQAPLSPALSLYSHIVYVKTLHKGQSVSYGGTFTAKGDMRVATVPLGYGDGYPRSLSGRGYVLIRGKRAPILGRICMDQFMVDVTAIEGAGEGDRVTLIGRDGEEEIDAVSLGELSGRFHYELMCGLGRRIPRVYREGSGYIFAKEP